MKEANTRIETRIWVKIRFTESRYQSLAEVVYFKNEMKVEFFQRWKWYFEYRAAIIRVKHPKAFIEYSTGPYQFILPEEEYRTKIRNQFLSDKRQLSKFKNQLNSIRENWNELFPIEDNPNWKRIQEKRKYYEKQLEISKAEYEVIFNH